MTNRIIKLLVLTFLVLLRIQGELILQNGIFYITKENNDETMKHVFSKNGVILVGFKHVDNELSYKMENEMLLAQRLIQHQNEKIYFGIITINHESELDPKLGIQSFPHMLAFKESLKNPVVYDYKKERLDHLNMITFLRKFKDQETIEVIRNEHKFEQFRKQYPSHLIVANFQSKKSKLYQQFKDAAKEFKQLKFIEFTDEVVFKREILQSTEDKVKNFMRDNGAVVILRKEEFVMRSIKHSEVFNINEQKSLTEFIYKNYLIDVDFYNLNTYQLYRNFNKSIAFVAIDRQLNIYKEAEFINYIMSRISNRIYDNFKDKLAVGIINFQEFPMLKSQLQLEQVQTNLQMYYFIERYSTDDKFFRFEQDFIPKNDSIDTQVLLDFTSKVVNNRLNPFRKSEQIKVLFDIHSMRLFSSELLDNYFRSNHFIEKELLIYFFSDSKDQKVQQTLEILGNLATEMRQKNINDFQVGKFNMLLNDPSEEMPVYRPNSLYLIKKSDIRPTPILIKLSEINSGNLLEELQQLSIFFNPKLKTEEFIEIQDKEKQHNQEDL